MTLIPRLTDMYVHVRTCLRRESIATNLVVLPSTNTMYIITIITMMMMVFATVSGLSPALGIFFLFSTHFLVIILNFFYFVASALILLPGPAAVMCFHYATLGPVQLWQPVFHCRRRTTARTGAH